MKVHAKSFFVLSTIFILLFAGSHAAQANAENSTTGAATIKPVSTEARSVQAQSSTETLVADSLSTNSGSTDSGHSVTNLHIQDQSGDQNEWEKYVEFVGENEMYQGYRSYTLPSAILPIDINSFQVQANYLGPATAGQIWTWSLYNWSTQNWVTVGDNTGAPWWGDWHLLTFDVTNSPADFVEPNTREIRLQVAANNTTDNMDLDYEAILVNYESSSGGGSTTVTYQPTTDLFPNPERGFYRYFESKSSSVPQTTWSVSALSSTNSVNWLSPAEEETITQVYCFFVLDNFLTTNIDASFLQNIRNNLTNIRAAGKKCILRFAYSNDSTDSDGDDVYDPDVFENGIADADLPQILAHIGQLDPIFNDYVDVISVVQAGFIGVWGEWYYTNYFIDDPANPGAVSATQYQRRRQVVDALLNALPAKRMIAVRYPLAKKEMYNRTTPITLGEAYQNRPVARVGYHNDAFLNSYGDSGTYRDASDRTYTASETTYLGMGGEINAPESGAPSRDCPNAIGEMETFHWSYINTDYYITALQNWDSGDCIHNPNDISNSILDRLGYRFRLTEATFPSSAERGTFAQIEIELVNEGFAASYNPRDVYLILKETASGNEYSFKLPVEPRLWLANGQTHLIDEAISLPANMPAGEYALLLHLPDPHPTLTADARYAIRLANAGLWPQSSWDGRNDLLHTMTVQAPSGPPTERVEQVGPSGDIAQSDPTFVWEPLSTATEYRVVIYDVANIAIIEDEIFSSSNVCEASTCTATFDNLTLAEGSYTWLIQAKNSEGDGPWSVYN